MSFYELDATDLRMIQQELEEQVRERSLLLGEISVTRSADTELLEATAMVLSDPLLASSHNDEHRRIGVSVSMFTESPETDREVLWGRISYSVKREHSNFFPVPEEYGDAITIGFNWEFDRETLKSGAAEVRERNSLHFVSVLPNDQLMGFVQCCSTVGERWASR